MRGPNQKTTSALIQHKNSLINIIPHPYALFLKIKGILTSPFHICCLPIRFRQPSYFCKRNLKKISLIAKFVRDSFSANSDNFQCKELWLFVELVARPDLIVNRYSCNLNSSFAIAVFCFFTLFRHRRFASRASRSSHCAKRGVKAGTHAASADLSIAGNRITLYF